MELLHSTGAPKLTPGCGTDLVYPFKFIKVQKNEKKINIKIQKQCMKSVQSQQ